VTELSELSLGPQVLVRGAPPAGFPVEPNTTAPARGREVLWLGPDEWLVLGGTESDYPDADAAVDVSANRVGFALAGEDAADVLAQTCALDLDAIPDGCCAQTLVAGVQAILVRDGKETWRILVRPSFAAYVRAWLEDALAGATSRRSSR